MQEEKLKESGAHSNPPKSQLPVHVTVIACLLNRLVFFQAELGRGPRRTCGDVRTIASSVSH